MARPSKQQIKQNIHDEGMKRFEVTLNYDKGERELAVEDARFIYSSSGHYDDDTYAKKAEDQPRFSIDRISPALDQVIGDQRQTRTNIKVIPEGGEADVQTARIYDGIVRNIQVQSRADNAYDNAFKEALIGGYGGWRILTEFNDTDFDGQDIKIAPILSAASSLYFDPNAQSYDKRDAAYAFLITTMSEEAFKLEYPEATITDFSDQIYHSGSCAGWFADNMVRVAEYWRKRPVIKTIALLSDGRVIDLEDEKAVLDELAQQGITITKTRKVKSHKVEMFNMNGAEVLGKPNQWAGKFIPLVPQYGKQGIIEGKTFTYGMVRKAKDPSRVYDYATSATVEAVALSPKDPYFYEPSSVVGYETLYENFNVKSQPFMPYTSNPENPGPPRRGGAPQVQAALIGITQQAAQDIEATTGIYAPSLGNAPQLLSEKSVQAQSQKGDRGSFVYQDNAEKSKEYTAEILIDLIPRIMDTQRIVKTLELDGSSKSVTINQAAVDGFNQPIIDEESGKQVIVNDLGKGKYTVIADTGPAFDTQREESARQLIELSGQSEVFANLTPDLIADNLNIVQSDEIKKRVRKFAIQQGIADPTDEEIQELGLDQPQQPDPEQVALLENVQAQTDKTRSEAAKNQATAMDTMAGILGDQIDALNTLMESFGKQLEAGIALSPQDRDLLVSQADIVKQGQDVMTGGGPNSQQAASIAQGLEEGTIAPEQIPP